MKATKRMKESQFKVAIFGVESVQVGGAHHAETLMVKQIQKVLKSDEIVFINSNPSAYPTFKKYVRMVHFFRTLQAYRKFRPIIWTVVHRFRWLPVTKFERALLDKNVDLVFFVGPYDRAVELRKIPFIVTVWDLGHRDLPSLPEMSANREFELREWRIRNVAIKAVAIVVDSDITKMKLGNLYGIEDSKIHSLPFCPQILGPVVAQDRETYAFYPAHFWSHKNHIVLLEAISLLKKTGGNPRRLKLTGLDRGNLRFLREKVKELEISELVDFLGFLKLDELGEMYNHAAVMVMPSLLGPTNLPPLESLLHGCPVAVTKNARANLRNWKGVIEVDAFDIEAWAELLSVDYELDRVDLPVIQSHLSATEVLNLKKLTSIFINFRANRNTHS
jgi:glycosyltransferase involved in cell wall biosynthesis